MTVERVISQLLERIERHPKRLTRSAIRVLRKGVGKPYKANLRALQEALRDAELQYVHSSGLSLDTLPLDERVTFYYISDDRLTGNRSAGTIDATSNDDARALYPHQRDALRALKTRYERDPTFAGLLVLPTGGGKTYTAVRFLIETALAQHVKVIWLAHRHELLEQALRTFQQTATRATMPHRPSFSYRLISGRHDTIRDVQPTDDVLIASKDSVTNGLQTLDERWLAGERRVVVVVDEAHHAPAKTYRRILDHFKTRYEATILGLTATPFRTAEREAGHMKTVFPDDILYKIDLKQLITRGILAAPRFVDVPTHVALADDLTDADIDTVQTFDTLPAPVIRQLEQHAGRNELIVQHYIERRDTYGQTLVFAMNRIHAVSLHAAFERHGVRASYIISGELLPSDDPSHEETIRAFRDGTLDVLINVNMLTEGTDLPSVQTAFLARPTTSKILMTQMIGRALRGVEAGGTDVAYIVNFTDEWNDRINWENPRHLLFSSSPEPTTSPAVSRSEQSAPISEWIASRMIQTLAHQLSLGVDGWLDDLSFSESIPVGVYSFDLLVPNDEEEYVTEHCEVLVFESTAPSYARLVQEMPARLQHEDEQLSPERLLHLTHEVESLYFDAPSYVPPYAYRDIRNIVRYVAMTGTAPSFYPFEDRDAIQIEAIAEQIVTRDFTRSEEATYLRDTWDTYPFIRMYFNYTYAYFTQAIDMTVRKKLSQ